MVSRCIRATGRVTHCDDLASALVTTKHVRMLRPAFVVLLASLSFACSKDPSATDAMRGGVPDDSVKTAALATTGTSTRAGVADDSIKPAPPPLVKTGRAGVADDSIRPVPPPLNGTKPAPIPTPR